MRNENMNRGPGFSGSNGDNRFQRDNKNRDNKGSFWGRSNTNGNSNGYANRGSSYNESQNDMGAAPARKFNPTNIERIKGEIVDKKVSKNPDGSSSVLIVLHTKDNQEVKVLLGPSSYLEKNRMALQIGDKVEVKVSRMSVNGQEMLIAYEIDKTGNLIRLRDEQGNPSWPESSSYNKSRSNNGWGNQAPQTFQGSQGWQGWQY